MILVAEADVLELDVAVHVSKDVVESFERVQASEETLSDVRDGGGGELPHGLEVLVRVTALHHLHDQVNSTISVECGDELRNEGLYVDTLHCCWCY